MDKLIILFGAGNNLPRVKKMVSKEYNKPILICDNDPGKVNQIIDNINIITFDKMLGLYKRNEIEKIIITPCCIDGICFQCIENNIDRNIIWFYNTYRKRLQPIDEKYADMVYAQDGEEVYLKSRFMNKEKGVYVDIGANHPFRFSNTYWAYRKGWRGINVEPDKTNYDLLMKFRGDDININCGISDEETLLNYYVFKENALNTFCIEEIKNKADIVDIRKIPVRRLDAVLRENGIKYIDYIDIDVEGMEINVLKSINWNEVLIDCILVEQRGMTLTEVVSSEVCSYLKEKGYTPTNKYNRTIIYERANGKQKIE